MTSLNILLNFLCAVLLKYIRCSVIKKLFISLIYLFVYFFIISFSICFQKRPEPSEQGRRIRRKILRGRIYFCILYSSALKLCRIVELFIQKILCFCFSFFLTGKRRHTIGNNILEFKFCCQSCDVIFPPKNLESKNKKHKIF